MSHTQAEGKERFLFFSRDISHKMFACSIHDKCGVSVSHKSEEHVHETHGHKTTTSSEHREEKHGEAHPERKAEWKGIS